MAAPDTARPRSALEGAVHLFVCWDGCGPLGKQLWLEEGLLRKELHHLGSCLLDAGLLLPRGHRGVEERGYIWG